MKYPRSCRASRRECKSEINIIPLLDVLLVLLLIFMTAATIMSQSIKVNLPNATVSKSINANNDLPIIIEISGIGRYNLIIGEKRIDQVSLEKILTETRNLLKLNKKLIFLIGGEKNVPYNEIIKILNLLHNIGIQSFALMTHPI